MRFFLTMLDIQYVRDHKDEVSEAARNKHLPFDAEELLAADWERVRLNRELEELYSLKNDINGLIAKATPEEREEILATAKEIKAKTEALEPVCRAARVRFDRLMAGAPTVPSPDTPIGKSDADNVEVAKWGEPKRFAFPPKTHVELGSLLDILDLERGAKVAGYRGYYWKNEGVLLVMGLMQYALRKMIEKGYRPMIPPTLIKGFPLFGSGYFSGYEYESGVDNIYQIASNDEEADGKLAKEKKFLVGTAEPSLLAYYANETLDGVSLPIRMCGFSQCYRSEIGTYGKDTKGIYRVHEFMKVEQVVIAPADIDLANELQEEMRSISREMHEELGLPYREIQICTGDMSAGKYRAFDIEAWLPGMSRWGETGSASSFLDWQSRRLNVKYADSETGEKRFAYMLNNTAMPSIRPLIAILENYQEADGSVVVPEALRPYVGMERILVPG